jgi:ATP-dependent helicase/nuclease subunit A
VAGACDARELRRLGQLVEAAYRYDASATLRPAEFVTLVESERVEDPTTAAVRVMTIHQSKGLEFDIVVLPELDEPLWKAPRRVVLPYRAERTGRLTGVYPAVGEELRCLFPELKDPYDQAVAGSVRDGLSTLYVALTRARHAVHVILCADPEKGPGKAKTGARLIREAVGAGGDLEVAEEGAVLYASGSPTWHLGGAAPRAPGVPVTASEARGVGLRTGAQRRYLPRRTPSGLEGGARIPAAELLRLDTTGALDRGTLVHAWFERIAWLEDGVPGEDTLREDAARICGPLAEADLRGLLEQFRRALAAPEVREALRRPAPPGEAEVHRELPFLHRDGASWLEGVVDRLVLTRWDGRVAGADILDYKTDAIGGSEEILRQRIARYRPQMQAYAGAVAGLYRLPADAVSARLLFVDGARLVPVDVAADSSNRQPRDDR